MTQGFNDDLSALKALGERQDLSTAEKDLVRQIANVLENLDRRLRELSSAARRPAHLTPRKANAP